MLISKAKLHMYLSVFFLAMASVVAFAGPIWVVVPLLTYPIAAHLLKQFLYSDREFKHDAPDYVLAALLKLAEATRGHQTLLHDQGTPFMNHGSDRKTSAFRVKAYCWNDDYYQTYNFKWHGFKVLWYKHCQRSTTMSRRMSENECAIMLKECLASLEEK